MKLVAYLRVSTDDKGQDPERQRPILEARAKAEGHEIVGWVIDEGTSGNVPALDRPRVKQLVLLAHRLGARGIMAESVDRWTRAGSEDLYGSMYVLRRDHGLILTFADNAGDPLMVEFIQPVMAILARLDNKRKSDLAKSSAAQRKARGEKLGRPPKPALTDLEFEAVVGLIKNSGRGLRKAAIEVSRMRGAFEVADPKVRRQRMVSQNWVNEQLVKRTESRAILGRAFTSRYVGAHQKGHLPEQVPA